MLNKVTFPKDAKCRFPRVFFSREEMDEMKKIGPVGMRPWQLLLQQFRYIGASWLCQKRFSCSPGSVYWTVVWHPQGSTY